ncbi:MAG: long-chain fatty acid--CoA ligase [Chitinophagales bacterium]|nr:long-chain fatty acid--CoA ligase [Chitinophagales bacterium]
MTFKNLNLALLHQLDNRGKALAVLRKEFGTYKHISYDALKDIAFSVACGIMEEGLQYRDKIAIISNTRAEWVFADLGCLLAGAINSAVYPTCLEDETAYIINDLQAKFVFVENEAQANKLLRIKEQIPSVKKVFVFEGSAIVRNGWIESFNQLVNKGHSWREKEVNIRSISELVEPKDTLTIIYTSGTTGQPKGVVLSHFNYLITIENMLKCSPAAFQQIERNLSFLPLAHALERIGGYYILLYNGKSIGYAESMDKIVDNLKEVKPDFIAGVPRVYEKMYARIQQELNASSNIKRMIFNWAFKVGKQAATYKLQGKPVPKKMIVRYQLANKLVFKKIKDKFGGRIRFFISGGAPLNQEIAEFFFALDILILEGWGATEGTAPYTFNKVEEFKFGTVGKAIPGIDIKIAEDGELLVKGPNLFKQYYNCPEETAAAFTKDGYFKTGDLGEMDAEGWVKITGRKKQLIITAGGKNIAPAAIQSLLVNGGLIEAAHIHGDKRKYITALVTLNKDYLGKLAKEEQILWDDWEELTEHPVIVERVQQIIDRANEKLASYMKIKYFKILPESFSIENREMTPTLKLKPDKIEARYAKIIQGMYNEERVETALENAF